jgi:hypothetical protein
MSPKFHLRARVVLKTILTHMVFSHADQTDRPGRPTAAKVERPEAPARLGHPCGTASMSPRRRMTNRRMHKRGMPRSRRRQLDELVVGGHRLVVAGTGEAATSSAAAAHTRWVRPRGSLLNSETRALRFGRHNFVHRSARQQGKPAGSVSPRGHRASPLPPRTRIHNSRRGRSAHRRPGSPDEVRELRLGLKCEHLPLRAHLLTHPEGVPAFVRPRIHDRGPVGDHFTHPPNFRSVLSDSIPPRRQSSWRHARENIVPLVVAPSFPNPQSRSPDSPRADPDRQAVARICSRGPDGSETRYGLLRAEPGS